MKMKTHEFILSLGKGDLTTELEDKVYESRFGDECILYSCNGECFLDCEIEAESFEEAVNSLIWDLTGAGLSVSIKIENVDELEG